ncbi:MAG: type II toxin-antitoxin system prevent-host-death family antitoxin, partial [Acidobacteria bacterium]|nr:type II toxin-antitoxin system prevent-host-death family antitoxin [Acidobacteriota bacterium]
ISCPWRSQSNNTDIMYDAPGGFGVRDVRQRSGELLRGAEDGRVALITKHGRPAILALPFDQRLLELGVHRALALRLFEQRLLTLTQAARVAGTPPEDFIALLGEAGIPAVDYPPDELDDEVHVAS